MRGGSFLTTLTLFACTVLPSTNARAYSLPGWEWPNQAGDPVIYRLHPDGSADVNDGSELEAIRRAFQTWDDVTCSYLQFAEAAWMEPKIYANDGINRIYWVEGPNDWEDASPATIALTFTFYRTTDLKVTDADMRMNGTHWSFTTATAEVGTGTPAKVDVETVVLHEIGHFFGLDHSRDESAAMYSSNNKPVFRTPALDDIQGICTLYPNGQSLPSPDPTEGVGSSCLANTDCETQLCAQDDANSRRYCTAVCNAQRPCPTGFECANTPSGDYCLLPIVPDELCDQCDLGAQCSSGFCTKVTNVNSEQPFCSRPCDPTPGQPAQCPSGYSCMPVLGSDVGGACAPHTGVCEPKGKGAQNEPCFGNGACKAGYVCVDYYGDSGLTFCYFECGVQFAGFSCTQGGGNLCLEIANRDNQAACFSVAHEGEPCIPEICDPTSFCAFDESTGVDSAICYRMCASTDDCGAQSQCMGYEGLPNLCTPLEGFKHEGESCTSDAECRSSVCRTYSNASLCTSVCELTGAANECGQGLKCLPSADATTGLCWPTSFVNMPGTGGPKVPFCACDTTSGCDEDCDCDAECTDGCGCSTTVPADSELSISALAALAALMLTRYRRAIRRRRTDS